jgi:hypothetical protein
MTTMRTWIRSRWSRAYAQVWLRRWSLCPLTFYTNSDDCREGGAFTRRYATATLMKMCVCVSARLIDVIGVLTSVVKPCNLQFYDV